MGCNVVSPRISDDLLTRNIAVSIESGKVIHGKQDWHFEWQYTTNDISKSPTLGAHGTTLRAQLKRLLVRATVTSL